MLSLLVAPHPSGTELPMGTTVGRRPFRGSGLGASPPCPALPVTGSSRIPCAYIGNPIRQCYKTHLQPLTPFQGLKRGSNLLYSARFLSLLSKELPLAILLEQATGHGFSPVGALSCPISLSSLKDLAGERAGLTVLVPHTYKTPRRSSGGSRRDSCTRPPHGPRPRSFSPDAFSRRFYPSLPCPAAWSRGIRLQKSPSSFCVCSLGFLKCDACVFCQLFLPVREVSRYHFCKRSRRAFSSTPLLGFGRSHGSLSTLADSLLCHLGFKVEPTQGVYLLRVFHFPVLAFPFGSCISMLRLSASFNGCLLENFPNRPL